MKRFPDKNGHVSEFLSISIRSEQFLVFITDFFIHTLSRLMRAWSVVINNKLKVDLWVIPKISQVEKD